MPTHPHQDVDVSVGGTDADFLSSEDHLAAAAHAKANVSVLYLEPVTPDDPRGPWRAYREQEGGEAWKTYDIDVIHLLFSNPEYGIGLFHRGTGVKWTPTDPAVPWYLSLAQALDDYYTLLTDDTIRVGDTVPNVNAHELATLVVRNPRAMPIAEALEDRAPEVLDQFIAGTDPAVRVARVTPHVTVRPHRSIWGAENTEIDDASILEAEGGWRVESIEPLSTILGPQGQLVLDAVKLAAPVFETPTDDESDPYAKVYDKYVSEQNRLHESPGTDALHAALQAAQKALDSVGAYGYWWSEALGDVWGMEITALAARDLLGKVEGWDTAAYDLLTRAWRSAFTHRLHPEDAVLADAAS
jgi:hypothetical protein